LISVSLIALILADAGFIAIVLASTHGSGPAASQRYNARVQPLLVDSLWVLASLALILGAAELFTNAVEWLGAKLRLSEGAVGSVLAAVGTALPETIIPVVAILLDAYHHRLFTPSAMAQSVGLGAIIGAPFMLGTLGFFIVGATYFASRAARKRSNAFSASSEVIRSDVEFFLVAFSLGAGAGLLRHYWAAMPHWLNWALGLCLIAVYFIYLRRVTRAGKALSSDELRALHLGLPLPWVDEHDPHHHWIVAQLCIAIALMFGGAHLFVGHLSSLATTLSVNPLILALLIVPVATELPEKFNSVIWVSRGKDTLAMGNISGAMVFQSTFPVTLGLFFLDWRFDPSNPALLSAVFGLAGALVVYAGLLLTRRVSPYALLAGGGLYLAFLLLVVLHLQGVIALSVGALPMHH
jgi:cation:H+ antiporter